MPTRRTLAAPCTLRGIGLHTGQNVEVTFRPAGSGAGITFCRLDRDDPPCPALVERVTATNRRTALGGEHGVQTVEHVLAAVYAAGLDDVEIALSGPEPPAADGSALPFLRLLADTGTTTHTGITQAVSLTQTLHVREGDAVYVARPAVAPRLSVTIEFAHPRIGCQSGSWDLRPETVGAELAGARTFGFAEEADGLHADDLARGAGPTCVLILTAEGVLGGPLRWPDEFVRHKALDLVGDLMLVGAPVAGDITARRPSHTGNVALARALRHLTTTDGVRHDGH